MGIGVVILNYNDYKTTSDCIDKTKTLLYVNHIVVVDNHSTDDSYYALNKKRLVDDGLWDLIQTDDNRGYSAGNNAGIKFLLNYNDIDIVGVVNPDVEINDDLLKKIKFAFGSSDKYALLTGVQHRADGAVSERAFWPKLNRWDVIRQNLCFLNKIHNCRTDYNKKYIKGKLLNYSKESNILDVDVVEGCCFFIKREAIECVGLLDERFFLFFEEDALAYKLNKIGKKVGVLHNTIFKHNHSTTIKNVYSIFKIRNILLRSRTKFYHHYVSKNIVDLYLYRLSVLVFYIESAFLYPYYCMRNYLRRK